MSCLSWNCRGLGHPRTVQVLLDLVRTKKPEFIFLMEILCSKETLENLKFKLGFGNLFNVDKVGRSGGLALYWKSSHNVRLLKCGRNFIDVRVENADSRTW